MTKIVARPKFDYRAATGSAALVVAGIIAVTALAQNDGSVHDATFVLALGGAWLIVNSLGRSLTFSEDEIKFKALTRPWKSWPVAGSIELRYVHQKIGSRWGLSKPDYLVLVRTVKSEAIALVDGQFTRQAVWCSFLEHLIAQGRLSASPEARKLLERIGGKPRRRTNYVRDT